MQSLVHHNGFILFVFICSCFLLSHADGEMYHFRKPKFVQIFHRDLANHKVIYSILGNGTVMNMAMEKRRMKLRAKLKKTDTFNTPWQEFVTTSDNTVRMFGHHDGDNRWRFLQINPITNRVIVVSATSRPTEVNSTDMRLFSYKIDKHAGGASYKLQNIATRRYLHGYFIQNSLLTELTTTLRREYGSTWDINSVCFGLFSALCFFFG